MHRLFLPITLEAGDVIRDKFCLLPGTFLVTAKYQQPDGGFLWTIARTDGSPLWYQDGLPIWQAETRLAETWALKCMGVPSYWRERRVA